MHEFAFLIQKDPIPLPNPSFCAKTWVQLSKYPNSNPNILNMLSLHHYEELIDILHEVKHDIEGSIIVKSCGIGD